MIQFAIVEGDDGLMVATIYPGQSPEDVAVCQHAVLVDAGPFATYEEAYDAITELEGPAEDEELP